ncbi:MAG: CDP-alcohol phosphatidyltransferase family protein [Candidatus Hydrothermales bacterium]
MKNLKKAFEDKIVPLLKFLNKIGVRPLHLTLSGFIFSLIPAMFYIKGKFFLAGILLLLFSLFDTLDGALARYQNSITDFGAFLDSVTDRIQEATIFLSLIYFYREKLAFLLIIFLSFLFSFLISYTRARAEGLNYKVKKGPMEREERIVFLGVSSIIGEKVFPYLLILFLILVIITFIRRMDEAYKIMKK